MTIQTSRKKQARSVNCRKGSSTGFTLIEVLVATAIVGTTMLAAFAAMRTCAAAAHHTRMLTKSSLLAESLLVEAKMSDNTSFQTKQGRTEKYSWKVRIAPTPVDNLGAIRVEVKWTEKGREQKYELFSLVQMKVFTERD